jgi:hypothetical protein
MLFCHFGGVVAGSIINNYDFYQLVLRKVVEDMSNGLLFVVCRNDDGYARVHGHHPFN